MGVALSRRSIKSIRRKQLAEAAFEVLKMHGISGTTFSKVAKQAGLSKGIIQHYFADKDALFEAALRESNAETRRCVTALYAHCDTPADRLYAVIHGNFAPTIFKPEVCHAWVSLCAQVSQNQQYQRIQTVIHSRMRSNLLNALNQSIGSHLAEEIAFNLTTMIDGLWMRNALQPTPMTSAEAIDHMEFALEHLFDGTGFDTSVRSVARDKIANVASVLFKT